METIHKNLPKNAAFTSHDIQNEVIETLSFLVKMSIAEGEEVSYVRTKNATCVHMRSGPARLTEISPATAEISASRDGNFPCEHMLVSQPGQPG